MPQGTVDKLAIWLGMTLVHDRVTVWLNGARLGKWSMLLQITVLQIAVR
jgi:hypothetical protein